MIASLKGELIEVIDNKLIIDVNGVGYEVHAPQSVLAHLPQIGEQTSLLIRQIFREDAVTLYGFQHKQQQRLFDLLRDVKGCGPRISLAILGELNESQIVAAISSEDIKTLTQASGVGKRLAERIIVELKDKISQEMFDIKLPDLVQSPTTTQNQQQNDLIDALQSLGYKKSEAELATHNLSDFSGSLEDQIKQALRSLQR